MDSNHRRRKPADLQSAPVGHLGNLPNPPYQALDEVVNSWPISHCIRELNPAPTTSATPKQTPSGQTKEPPMPVKGRQMAVILPCSAPAAICEQRHLFCKNQSAGQNFSRNARFGSSRNRGGLKPQAGVRVSQNKALNHLTPLPKQYSYSPIYSDLLGFSATLSALAHQMGEGGRRPGEGRP
jgi:hypothetical protein